MASVATYKIIGITPAGRILETCHVGAPSEGWLCTRGKNHGCAFMIRYFPSKKGWRILDIRDAKCAPQSTREFRVWYGQVRDTRYYPNEDAAVMAAILILNRQPSLL